MDDVISHAMTFNGPLEAGVRTVAILNAAYPHSFDIQRLTALDYLLTHTSTIGGPNDLHPATPIRTPATEVRRRLVHDAILLMMTRDLIEREVHSDGIRYVAGEAAASFIASLRTDYFNRVKICADWLAQHLADHTDDQFNALMRELFRDWVEQFQAIEQSAGAGS